MKNWVIVISWVACLFFGVGSLCAQNREIQFETGSFQEVLTKAQKAHKFVFMDCYTSWCGPCKLLAKNVFTQDSVADFFNAKFVNFSIDMEKGEGIELQKKYRVEAFPTLLLLDAQGMEVYRSVGGCSAEALLSNFRLAMEPGNTVPVMAEKFAAGERDPKFVCQYWTALKKGRLFDDLQKSTVAYFKDMRVADLCNEQNWPLYDQFVDIDNPLHHLMAEHIEEFKKLKGAEGIEGKLYEEYDMAIMGRIPNVGHTAGQIEQFSEDIRKIGFKDEKQLFYLQTYLKIAKMKVERQYDEFIGFMETGLTEFSDVERGRVIVALLMLCDGTPQQREKGNKILIGEAQRIMQQNGGKLLPDQEQLLGFLQYKLIHGKE